MFERMIHRTVTAGRSHRWLQSLGLLLLGACLMLTVLPVSALAADPVFWSDEGARASAFAVGDGSEDNAYQISSAAELGYMSYCLAKDWNNYKNKYYKLTGDINLSAYKWIPMGSDSGAFMGTFDGGDFSITNMKIDLNGGAATDRFAGLFGKIDSATVRNVTIGDGSTVTAHYTGSSGPIGYGGVVGDASSSNTIENCHSSASIAVTFSNDSLYAYAGGVVGYLEKGIVKNCSNSGAVGGTSVVAGGVAGGSGNMSAGTIQNCWNTGNITVNGSWSYAGGIVGDNYCSSSKVENCYNTGNIQGYSCYAGVAASNSGVIENCYSAGVVAAPSNNRMPVGGLIGDNSWGSAIHSYWRKDTGINATLSAAGSSGTETDVLSFDSGGAFTDGGYVTISGTGYSSLLPALSAWVAATQGTGYWFWTGDPAAPTLTEDPPPATYAVTIHVNKDGSPWTDHNKSFKLMGGGTTVTNLASVVDGSYDVYEGDTDTGADVVVSGGNASATVDYYTVTFYDGDTAYTSGAQSPQIILKNGKAAKPASTPIKDKYVFDSWVTENGGSTAFDFENTSITAAASVYAKWTFDTSTEVKVTLTVSKPEPYYKGDSLILTAEVTNKNTSVPVTEGTVQFYKGENELGSAVSYIGDGSPKGFYLSVTCGESSKFPYLTAGARNDIKAVYTPSSGTTVKSEVSTLTVSAKQDGNSYLGSLKVNTTYDGSADGTCPVQFIITNNGGEKGISTENLTITGEESGHAFSEFKTKYNDEKTTAYVYVKKPGTYIFTAKMDKNADYTAEETAAATVQPAKLTITPEDVTILKNGTPEFSYKAEGLKGGDMITNVTYGTTANGNYDTAGSYTISIADVTMDNKDYYTIDEKTATLTVLETYTVTVAVNKDGAAWTGHSKTFTLQKDSEAPIGLTVVPAGTYKLLDGGTDTGKTVIVTDKNVSFTLNYYTVSFSATAAGLASGSTVSAVYGGADLASGNIVLGGKRLIITAAGTGADLYDYKWSGGGTNGETTAALTVDALAEKIDAVCTVSGSNYYSEGNQTTTEKNPDGSVTTTTKKPDGTITETTGRPDGTLETLITDKNGDQIYTEQRPDGTNITTEIPKIGESTARITLPEHTETVVSFPAADGTLVLRTLPDGTEVPVAYSLVEDGKVYVRLDSDSELRVTTRTGLFDDMEGHWAEESADFTGARALFEGTEPRTFSPEQPMTRAMLTTVLYRLDGTPDVGEAVFSDVEVGKWYTEGVVWAAENKIANGIGGGLFGTDLSITRQELAVMLWNYAKYDGQDVSVGSNTDILSYSDIGEAGEWAIPALQWACGAGILQGNSDGTLDPTGIATRAEVSETLTRFIYAVLH